MKNVRKFILNFSVALILLIGIVGCEGCEDPLLEPEEEKVSLKEVDDIIISEDKARVNFANYKQHRGEIIKIYENNGREVDAPNLQNQQNYKGQSKRTQTKAQQDEKGFVPVEYVDYDFEQLKKYMKFIEQQTAEAGYDISTMRVYFANYNENNNKDKSRRNTVMFVPTIDIRGNESAYYLSDQLSDGELRPILLDDSFKDLKKPAPRGKLFEQTSTAKASILPTLSATIAPVFFQRRVSVIGNEGHLNP